MKPPCCWPRETAGAPTTLHNASTTPPLKLPLRAAAAQVAICPRHSSQFFGKNSRHWRTSSRRKSAKSSFGAWAECNPLGLPLCSFFFDREVQRPDFSIQIRIRIGAIAVEINYYFQRGHAAVVHIGCGQRDIAQRRRLEFAAVLLALRHFKAAEVQQSRAPTDAGPLTVW